MSMEPPPPPLLAAHLEVWGVLDPLGDLCLGGLAGPTAEVGKPLQRWGHAHSKYCTQYLVFSSIQ
jgi:hypothetical protein